MKTRCHGDSGPRGFSLTARRLAGWTSNLLVTVVVLLVGVTFGRQLTAWWMLDPLSGPPSASLYSLADPGALGDAESLHHLEFAEMPVRLGRQAFVGDTGTVLEALRTQVRHEAQRVGPTLRQPGADERKLLAGLDGMAPVEQLPGKWRMYQLDRPVPMVVVTASRGLSPEGEDRGSGRVLCWGLALPANSGLNEWTLLTCSLAGESTASASDPLTVPLPSGARRQMQLQSEDGGGMLLFSGTGDAEDWWLAIDHWFQQHGWSSAEGWKVHRGWRHRRYEDPAAGVEAEVLMEDQDDLRVLLTVSRP